MHHINKTCKGCLNDYQVPKDEEDLDFDHCHSCENDEKVSEREDWYFECD